MAHEFGHAIHSVLAADKPISVQHPSLPLAETASVFGEMILNDRLLDQVKKKDKKILLAEQIDDFYATIMRQAYFTIFEISAHETIGKNSATNIDELSEIYMANLREQFGNSLKVSDDFKYEWLYIPHFYHSPFYCYAYSFGNLLVMSLYQQFKNEGKEFIQAPRGIASMPRAIWWGHQLRPGERAGAHVQRDPRGDRALQHGARQDAGRIRFEKVAGSRSQGAGRQSPRVTSPTASTSPGREEVAPPPRMPTRYRVLDFVAYDGSTRLSSSGPTTSARRRVPSACTRCSRRARRLRSRRRRELVFHDRDHLACVRERTVACSSACTTPTRSATATGSAGSQAPGRQARAEAGDRPDRADAGLVRPFGLPRSLSRPAEGHHRQEAQGRDDHGAEGGGAEGSVGSDGGAGGEPVRRGRAQQRSKEEGARGVRGGSRRRRLAPARSRRRSGQPNRVPRSSRV